MKNSKPRGFVLSGEKASKKRQYNPGIGTVEMRSKLEKTVSPGNQYCRERKNRLEQRNPARTGRDFRITSFQ